MVIEYIRDIIKSYSGLKDNALLNVDYLSDKPIEYVIESVPSDEQIETYIDGSALMGKTFVFATKENYGEDVLQNIANLDFWEGFIDWVDDLVLLDMPDNCYPQKLKCLTGGYLINADTKTGKYQIQMRLEYLKEVSSG